MHQTHTAAGVCSDRLRSARLAQGPDVVDDVGAQVQRLLHELGLVGIDRDRHAQAHGIAKDGDHTLAFLLQRDGGTAGSRGFTADIQDVGALAQQLLAMAQRSGGICMLPAIGKRIGRGIDNAHDLRASQIDGEACGLPDRAHGVLKTTKRGLGPVW